MTDATITDYTVLNKTKTALANGMTFDIKAVAPLWFQFTGVNLSQLSNISATITVVLPIETAIGQNPRSLAYYKQQDYYTLNTPGSAYTVLNAYSLPTNSDNLTQVSTTLSLAWDGRIHQGDYKTSCPDEGRLLLPGVYIIGLTLSATGLDSGSYHCYQTMEITAPALYGRGSYYQQYLSKNEPKAFDSFEQVIKPIETYLTHYKQNLLSSGSSSQPPAAEDSFFNDWSNASIIVVAGHGNKGMISIVDYSPKKTDITQAYNSEAKRAATFSKINDKGETISNTIVKAPIFKNIKVYNLVATNTSAIGKSLTPAPTRLVSSNLGDSEKSPPGKLSDCRLVLFAGCSVGGNISEKKQTYASALPKSLLAAGANFVVLWNNSLQQSQYDIYFGRLWQCLSEGYILEKALIQAANLSSATNAYYNFTLASTANAIGYSNSFKNTATRTFNTPMYSVHYPYGSTNARGGLYLNYELINSYGYNNSASTEFTEDNRGSIFSNSDFYQNWASPLKQSN